MYPQTLCNNLCIISFVFFLLLQMSRQNASPREGKFKLPAREHWLHLFDFSPLCVFKCVFKLSAREEAYSHWLHLFDFSPVVFQFPKPFSDVWKNFPNNPVKKS